MSRDIGRTGTQLFAMLLVAAVLLHGAMAAGSMSLVQKAVNDKHTFGVNTVKYNPRLNILVSASTDQYIGVWNGTDLSNNNLLDQSLYPVIELFDSKYIYSQVSGLDCATFNNEDFVVTNLMGNYIKTYKINLATRSLTPAGLLDYTKNVFSFTGWKVIPYTSRVMVGTRLELHMRDLFTGDMIYSRATTNRPRNFCLVNAQQVLMTENNQVMLRNQNDGALIMSYPTKDSPIFCIHLGSLATMAKTEVACQHPNAVLNIYKYDRLNEGISRFYKNLNGFYESSALAPIPNTPYVISGSGNRNVMIFDIIRSPNGNLLADQKYVVFNNTLTIASSVLSIEYVQGSNTVYLSFWGQQTPDGMAIPGNRIGKFEFCRDPRCVQCSLDFRTCEMCAVGYTDSPTNSLDNSCIDCSLPANTNLVACSGVKLYSIRRVLTSENLMTSKNLNTEWGSKIDLTNTGAVVKISFTNANTFSDKMTLPNLSPLDSKFTFQIESAEKQRDFIYSYFVKDGGVYLAINSTIELKDKLLTMNIEDPVIINFGSTANSLVVVRETKTLRLSIAPSIDATVLSSFNTATTTMMSIGGATLVAAGAMALICSGSFAPFFFTLFQIVQVDTFDGRSSRRWCSSM